MHGRRVWFGRPWLGLAFYAFYLWETNWWWLMSLFHAQSVPHTVPAMLNDKHKWWQTMAPANLLNDVPFCAVSKFTKHTVDGRNVATSWWGVYPIIYRVWTIQGGAGFLPSTVSQNIVCNMEHLLWYLWTFEELSILFYITCLNILRTKETISMNWGPWARRVPGAYPRLAELKRVSWRALPPGMAFSAWLITIAGWSA